MVTERFHLTVPGEPVPQERARKGRNGWYTPRRSQEYRERIRAAWMVEGRPTVEGPVTVSARFFLPRKPSHLKSNGQPRKGAPSHPPCDLDNLLKSLCDGLQPHALADDKQVVCFAGVSKRYAPPGMEPWTDVDVWTAT